MIKSGFNKKLEKVWGDDYKVTLINKEIINSKPALKKLLNRYYEEMFTLMKPGGKSLELGSGGGFIKELRPDIITSEIIDIPGVDLVCDATEAPFNDGELTNIMMRGVLHHIHDPIRFFKECSRILKPGGRIIINDTIVTPFSYVIYKYLHFEHFDYTADWKFKKGQPLMDCNLALPSIIFKKKYNDFIEMFPEFSVTYKEYHTYFIYLLMGGYSYPSLVPGWAFDMFMKFEALLFPARKILANMVTIVIEKKSTNRDS